MSEDKYTKSHHKLIGLLNGRQYNIDLHRVLTVRNVRAVTGVAKMDRLRLTTLP